MYLARALRGADDHVAALVHDFGHVVQQPVQLERHLRDQTHVHDACRSGHGHVSAHAAFSDDRALKQV